MKMKKTSLGLFFMALILGCECFCDVWVSDLDSLSRDFAAECQKCIGKGESRPVTWLSADRRQSVSAVKSCCLVVEPQFGMYYDLCKNEPMAYYDNECDRIVAIDCIPEGINGVNLHGGKFVFKGIPNDNAVRYVSVRRGGSEYPTLSETIETFPNMEVLNYAVRLDFWEKGVKVATNRIDNALSPVLKLPRLKKFFYYNDMPFCGDITKCILKFVEDARFEELGLWLVCASSNENGKVDFVTPKNPSIRPDVVESEDRMEIKVNVGTQDVGAIVWPDVVGKKGCKIRIQSDRLQMFDFGPVLKYPALEWLYLDLKNIVPLNPEKMLKKGTVHLQVMKVEPDLR